jgi:Family of unknown function (DUF5684)
MLTFLGLAPAFFREPGFELSPLLAILGALWVLTILAEIVGLAAVFRRAGRPWWSSLIPFWSHYVLLGIIGMSPGWLALVAADFGLHLAFGDGESAGYVDFAPGAVLAQVASWTSLILWLVMSLKLAECFRRSALFGLGLFAFGFVFLNILGFGDNRYRKPKF